MTTTDAVRAMLGARSVAVVGASARPGSFGERLVTAVLRTRRALGYTLAVSSGQELVTTVADYVDYALDLPETRVLALLLESPRATDRLLTSLRRAAEADVPAVLLTVGGSPAGAEM